MATYGHMPEGDGMLGPGMEDGMNGTYERLDEMLATTS